MIEEAEPIVGSPDLDTVPGEMTAPTKTKSVS